MKFGMLRTKDFDNVIIKETNFINYSTYAFIKMFGQKRGVLLIIVKSEILANNAFVHKYFTEMFCAILVSEGLVLRTLNRDYEKGTNSRPTDGLLYRLEGICFTCRSETLNRMFRLRYTWKIAKSARKTKLPVN